MALLMTVELAGDLDTPESYTATAVLLCDVVTRITSPGVRPPGNDTMANVLPQVETGGSMDTKWSGVSLTEPADVTCGIRIELIAR